MLIQLIQNSEIIHSQRISPSNTPLLPESDPNGSKFKKIHEKFKDWDFGIRQGNTYAKANAIEQVDFNIDKGIMTVTLEGAHEKTILIQPELLEIMKTESKSRLIDLVVKCAYPLLKIKQQKVHTPLADLDEKIIELDGEIRALRKKSEGNVHGLKEAKHQLSNLEATITPLREIHSLLLDQFGQNMNEEERSALENLTNQIELLSQHLGKTKTEIDERESLEKLINILEQHKGNLTESRQAMRGKMQKNRKLPPIERSMKTSEERELEIYKGLFLNIIKREPRNPEEQMVHQYARQLNILETGMRHWHKQSESEGLSPEEIEKAKSNLKNFQDRRDHIFWHQIFPILQGKIPSKILDDRSNS